MSLHDLLPPAAVAELLERWPDGTSPDEPLVYERNRTTLDATVTPDWLWEHVRHGCVPADEVRCVRGDVPSITAHAFSTNGRTDGPRLSALYERGYTIRLGNLQRVMVPLAKVSCGIQQETGYSNYVHAFLTPSGCQGLRHHWDQQMAIIVQLAGVKRWQLWRPVVEAPMRDVNDSGRVWREDFLVQWEKAGPDLQVDLKPGQALLLPRGWVHNPFVPEGGEDSIHLTFAIRERTPYWLAEKLVEGALQDPEFRRVILPGELLGEGLAHRIDSLRDRLVAHVALQDLEALAERVRTAARTEREYTT